jgi:hypothetical protein
MKNAKNRWFLKFLVNNLLQDIIAELLPLVLEQLRNDLRLNSEFKRDEGSK